MLTIINGPIERILSGFMLALLIITGLQYLKRSRKREDSKERLILLGFAYYFMALVISMTIHIFSEYAVPGTYINHIYYGDYSKSSSSYYILVMISRYVYAIGAAILIFTFELTIKKTKYILTLIQGILIILIIISPFNLAYILIIYVLGVLSSFIIVSFLLYMAKWSKFEFKLISSLLLLGFEFIVFGLVFGNPDIKRMNFFPVFLSPLSIIIGTVICLSPTFINPRIYTQSSKFWFRINTIFIIFVIFMEFIFIYYRFPIYLCIAHLIYATFVIYTFIRIERIVKSQKNEIINMKFSNLLSVFAKDGEVIEKLIIQNANDLIEIFDNKFRIEYINEQSHLDILGYLKQNLLGKKREDFLHPEDIKKSIVMHKNLVKNGEEFGELRYRKTDGTYIWVEIRGVKFKDIENNTKYLLISRDITKRKQAERIIENENKRLKELDELKDDFLIHATHDLKTPVTYILGNSDIIYEEIKIFNEKIREIAENKKKIEVSDIKPLKEIETLAKDLNEGSLKLNENILNLFNLSKLDSGKFELHKEDVDVSKIIKECIRDVIFQAKRRNIEIFCELPSEIYLYVDKQRIKEILHNLISNALKYTPVGGKISIYGKERDHAINLYIKDTGIGLTSQEKEKLFTKFCKIKKNEDNLITDGFGVSYGYGLYMTKKLVMLHGGKIKVKSDGRNSGSIFKISLPLMKKILNEKC